MRALATQPASHTMDAELSQISDQLDRELEDAEERIARATEGLRHTLVYGWGLHQGRDARQHHADLRRALADRAIVNHLKRELLPTEGVL